ncbi:HlyD family type I secretion periplasmic adaptor subunit [Massilia sp. MB5]|uniref:HlyD family type I secretion periplasmic adaptor subunit n=1 Tax=Massilia sp. MB5 TaxID=2919578 RepID=UPI001F0E6511|nr:HlyD family type I secretion periplasmic adaptor subunit [Massilia sp. MB5]UMR29701.1 HlyD family type I secretion periplasmic adaptor subunit [Massilia sp. MB5]
MNDAMTMSDKPATPLVRPQATLRWHDPLRLMQDEAPVQLARIVLWSVCGLVLVLLLWACIGKLDIVVSTEGKLVPQTLVKVVQPAEAGVVTALLVAEGDAVRAGQPLARLDPTVAAADQRSVASDLAMQLMQQRRIEAELAGRAMTPAQGDDRALFAVVAAQQRSHTQAYQDSIGQEEAVLVKLQHERSSAIDQLRKLEQTLPTYQRVADGYAKLEREGFMGALVVAERERDAIEKARDLDAQKSAVAALDAGTQTQRKRISQLHSSYRSDLQRELAELRSRIAQLQPTLAKSAYRTGLMELRAPQAGVIKDLATTTVGAVVQPGSTVMTLVPAGELLYADVGVKNEDVGFVRVGQRVQIKVASYPFQQYGMLTGEVVHLSLDASSEREQTDTHGGDSTARTPTTYKARVKLDDQVLRTTDHRRLQLAAGMQVAVEIHQGRRTVLEYLLSPVHKVMAEAARER